MKDGLKRIICLCLAVVMAAAMAPDVYAANGRLSTAGEYLWKQGNNKGSWGKLYPDYTWTSGCAIVAVCIQIARTDLVRVDESAAEFDRNTMTGFNPASFARAAGMKNKGNISWVNVKKVVPGFLTTTDSKYHKANNGWSYFPAESKQDIVDAMTYFLDSGYYPIIEGPGSKNVHYVAVVETTDSDVKVIDPATGKKKSLFDVKIGGNKWTVANIEKHGKPKGYGSCMLYKVDETKLLPTQSAQFGYDCNGGAGSFSSFTVDYSKKINLSSERPKRDGYTFKGWSVCRENDNTWYVAGKGWQSESSITKKGYDKKLYEPGRSYTLDASWGAGLKAAGRYRFYAEWMRESEPSNSQVDPLPTAAPATVAPKTMYHFSFNPGQAEEIDREAYDDFNLYYGEGFQGIVPSDGSGKKVCLGWNIKRENDNTWYVAGKGWCSEQTISQNGYVKKLYESGKGYYIDSSWSWDCEADAYYYTLYEVWKDAGEANAPQPDYTEIPDEDIPDGIVWEYEIDDDWAENFFIQ